MAVKLTLNVGKVKNSMRSAVSGSLRDIGAEIASVANRNVQLDGDAGRELRGSYKYTVNKADGTVTIGTGKEEGYWEEFGTGSHADTAKNGGKKGRADWWVYNEGEEYDGPESAHYATQADAQNAAAYISATYGKKAVASNGREPSYTLENAFLQTKDIAKWLIEEELRAHLE